MKFRDLLNTLDKSTFVILKDHFTGLEFSAGRGTASFHLELDDCSLGFKVYKLEVSDSIITVYAA